ncbi:MAG: ATP-binding cassette domain-containing protein [Salaquimonas sp.]|nr:ATP-binding cassette domain-containing protein [Salaquimonas sp.]
MGAPVMGIVGATKYYGPVQALKAVSLNFRRGQVHAVVGENGAGKSTLIGIAAGAVRADFAVIRVGGREIKRATAKKLHRAGVSVTYQHPELAEEMTVYENMQLAAPSLTGAAGRAEAKRLLEAVGSEQHAMSLDARVRDLTLAQFHIIEIAGAIASKPKVLFLDEPTEPFQQADIDKLFELIKQLREEGVAIVYVSHRLREIEEIADQITVLRDGQIIESGPAFRIKPDQIVTMIAGRPLEQIFPDKAKGPGETILEVENLSGTGFADVSFTARAGEIIGVTGIEGEGQREFLRTLAGLKPRTTGSVRIKGKAFEGNTSAAARSAGIGFVTDDRHEEGLFLTLRLRENIGIGALDRISTASVISRKRDQALTREVMDRLGIYTGYRIKEYDDTRAAELSGGNQQKVLIGREIAGEPEVILIDEPTKGVDVGARAEIYERLRELADSGVAVVVSSADGMELEGLCDRVAVFARGQIVKELEGDSLTDEAITEANLTATVARADGPARAKQDESIWRRIMAANRFPAAVLTLLTAIVLFGTASISEYFLSPFNIETILTFLAILAFLSIAQLGTILVGRIDLSVGALAGFVVVLASYLTPDGAGVADTITGVAMILAITAGFGLVQGWLVTWLNIPAIVVTLATFIGLQGMSLVLRPQAAGTITDYLSDVTQWSIAGMPACFLAIVIVVVVFEFVLFRTRLGRRLRAVGSSPVGATRVGIRVNWHIVLAFVLSGVLTGIAGLILAGQVGIGSPATGIDYTLMSITAVVLGGTRIAGGRGSVLSVFMGAALVQSLSSASSFVNQDSAIHLIVLGAVTLVAATFFSVARRDTERTG